MNQASYRGRPFWIGVVFFLIAAAPGCWTPSLSNILRAEGYQDWVEWIFMVPGLAGLLSPLVFAAQVDQRFQAQKVLGVIMAVGAVFLFAAFWALEAGWGIGWFASLLAINAFISAPAWSLITVIALNHGDDPRKTFGLFRSWGTIGWMVAGFAMSLLALDQSAKTGLVAAGLRWVAAGFCFLLPATPPKAEKAKSWVEITGLSALGLLRDRELAFFFLTTFLFSIPLSAFYMHTPVHLADLGVEWISGTMACAQIVEAIALLLMGRVLLRFRIRYILVTALAAGVVRFGLCASNAVAGLFFSILLHGICWAFFYEAGRLFVNARVQAGVRSQAQALLGLCTGGLAGLTGILVCRALYRGLVLHGTGGWSPYWLVLTGFTLAALVVFVLRPEPSVKQRP